MAFFIHFCYSRATTTVVRYILRTLLCARFSTNVQVLHQRSRTDLAEYCCTVYMTRRFFTQEPRQAAAVATVAAMVASAVICYGNLIGFGPIEIGLHAPVEMQIEEWRSPTPLVRRKHNTDNCTSGIKWHPSGALLRRTVNRFVVLFCYLLLLLLVSFIHHYELCMDNFAVAGVMDKSTRRKSVVYWEGIQRTGTTTQ